MGFNPMLMLYLKLDNAKPHKHASCIRAMPELVLAQP